MTSRSGSDPARTVTQATSKRSSANPFDGPRGQAEAGARPGLDLAEHDAVVTADDEVELTLPAAPVPAQHRVALTRVPGHGQFLASGAQVQLPPVNRRPTTGPSRRH
jgi:hypothetical protein